jgi:hypothetical protein
MLCIEKRAVVEGVNVGLLLSSSRMKCRIGVCELCVACRWRIESEVGWREDDKTRRRINLLLADYEGEEEKRRVGKDWRWPRDKMTRGEKNSSVEWTSRLGFDLGWESISTDANLEVAIAGREWAMAGRSSHNTQSSRQRQRRACSRIRDHQSEGSEGRRRSGDRNDRLADVPHARVLSLLLLLSLLPLA